MTTRDEILKYFCQGLSTEYSNIFFFPTLNYYIKYNGRIALKLITRNAAHHENKFKEFFSFSKCQPKNLTPEIKS